MYKYKQVEKTVNELEDIECCICGKSCLVATVTTGFDIQYEYDYATFHGSFGFKDAGLSNPVIYHIIFCRKCTEGLIPILEMLSKKECIKVGDSFNQGLR